jgi:hypothetical protein
MDMLSRPRFVIKGDVEAYKEHIEQSLDVKEIDFTIDKNKNPWISAEIWLQRYMFKYLHEIFFIEFSNILVEWIQRLIEQIGRYCIFFFREIGLLS